MRKTLGQANMLFFLGLMTLLLGCTQEPRPSILLIALDDFQVNDLRCSQEQMNVNGFRTLCSDFIRFTHAYSTSTLTVPALASILTGKLPLENKVHDNSSWLSREELTLAEVAHGMNFRTAFFSGGAPVLRKTGLSQGFEYFDDQVQMDFDRFFRPLRNSKDRFFRWIDRLSSKESFFSLIYSTDLKFQTHQTISGSGEMRSQNIEAQLEETSEVLAEIFQGLKGHQRWNDTLVIVAGLSGRPTSQHEFKANILPPPLQLHSHDMQVVLFIKPPTKVRDETATWKVDRNVSIADLGPTMFEFLQLSINRKTLPPAEAKAIQADSKEIREPSFGGKQSLSLKPLLENRAVPSLEDRSITLETAWAQWHYGLGKRYALLKKEYLYFHDVEATIYNTFVDHLEVFPMKGRDIEKSEILSDFLKTASRLGLEKFDQKRFFQKSSNLDAIPYPAWAGKSFDLNLRKIIMDYLRERQHPQLVDWALRLALDQRDWVELEKLAVTFNRPSALLLARLQNKKTDKLPLDPCLTPLFDSTNFVDWKSQCQDPALRTLLSYVTTPSENLEEKQMWKKKVEGLIEESYIAHRLNQTHHSLGRLWDLQPSIRVEPTMAEYAFHFPVLNRLRIQTLNSMLVRSRPTNE